jgi:NhaP-type Na+/H+ or K+/H+ antiporter
MVMHRHWPPATKVLASATLAGAVVIILLYALRSIDWTQAMFATRWFIVFLPMTVFWGGVWLRRRHRTVSWVLAGVLLGVSVVVSLLGATGPLPRDGF